MILTHGFVQDNELNYSFKSIYYVGFDYSFLVHCGTYHPILFIWVNVLYIVYHGNFENSSVRDTDVKIKALIY